MNSEPHSGIKGMCSRRTCSSCTRLWSTAPCNPSADYLELVQIVLLCAICYIALFESIWYYSYILEHILLRQFFSFAICEEVKCSEAAASCGEGNGSARSCSIWYLQQRGPPMSTAARSVTQISSKSREIRIPWRKQHKLCVFEKLKPWVSLLSVEPLWIVMKKVRPVAVLNVASCC